MVKNVSSRAKFIQCFPISHLEDEIFFSENTVGRTGVWYKKIRIVVKI
jgi:hypothetical protein